MRTGPPWLMPPQQGPPRGQVPRADLELAFSGSTVWNTAIGPRGWAGPVGPEPAGHRLGHPVGLFPGLDFLLQARQGGGLAQTTCESSGRLAPPLGAHHAGHRKEHLLSHTGPR